QRGWCRLCSGTDQIECEAYLALVVERHAPAYLPDIGRATKHQSAAFRAGHRRDRTDGVQSCLVLDEEHHRHETENQNQEYATDDACDQARLPCCRACRRTGCAVGFL